MSIYQHISSTRTYHTHAGCLGISLHVNPIVSGSGINAFSTIQWDSVEQSIKIQINWDHVPLKNLCFNEKIKTEDVLSDIECLAMAPFIQHIVFEKSPMSSEQKSYYIAKFNCNTSIFTQDHIDHAIANYIDNEYLVYPE